MSKEATDRPLLSKGTQAGTGSAPGPPPPSRPSRLRGCTTRVLGKGVALQPAKPERLARALRSNTFQLTSAMSPANPNTALGQPPWPPPPGPPVSSSRPAPPPPARHCREARRPEVSARAIFNLVPRPPKRRRFSSSGE